ncbi:MAG: hypothetical protein R2932_11080 [Caldilineaceae bacterium]
MGLEVPAIFGGFVDSFVRLITDVFMTIPALAIQLLWSSSIRVLEH